MSQPFAPLSLYDVLRAIVRNTRFANEQEERDLNLSIDMAEKIGAFSRVADAIVCQHNEINAATGKCADCDRQINRPAIPDYRYGARY